MTIVHLVNSPIPLIKSAPWVPEAYIKELDTAAKAGDIGSLGVQEAIFMDKKAHKQVCFNNILSYTRSPNAFLRKEAITIAKEHLHIQGGSIATKIEDFAISSVLAYSDDPAMQTDLFYELCVNSNRLVESFLQTFAQANENTKTYMIERMQYFVDLVKFQDKDGTSLYRLLENPVPGAYNATAALLQALTRRRDGDLNRLHDIALRINSIPIDPPPLYYVASKLTEVEAKGLVLQMAQNASKANYIPMFNEMNFDMLTYCLTLPDMGIPLETTRNIVACCFSSKVQMYEGNQRIFIDLAKMTPMPSLTVFVIYLILSAKRSKSNWINEYVLPGIDEKNPWANPVLSMDLANCCIVNNTHILPLFYKTYFAFS